MKRYWLFLVFFLGVISPVLGEPAIDIQFNYYKIYPKSKQDLEKEMTKKSPIIFQGKKFKGYTKWFVNWKFRWWQTPSDCKITHVDTTLKVVYTLPKIPDSYPVKPETRQVFERYLTALFKHEQNHKNSGLYAARDIEKALLNLGTFANCQALETTANTIGHRIIKQYNQRDIDYDRLTEHGKKEGVMLQNFGAFD